MPAAAPITKGNDAMNEGQLVIEAEQLYTTLTAEYSKEVKAHGFTHRAQKLQSARLNAFDRYARRINAYAKAVQP